MDIKDFLWFIKTSYSYINPVGINQHWNFLMDFPDAWESFAKSMQEDRRE